jgi:hypothetical protein
LNCSGCSRITSHAERAHLIARARVQEKAQSFREKVISRVGCADRTVAMTIGGLDGRMEIECQEDS